MKTVERTKEKLEEKDLKKIQELTKKMKAIKKAFIKLCKEKEEIDDEMQRLEEDGYCDCLLDEEGYIEYTENTLPEFEEAIEEYDDIMRDMPDFWLSNISNK